MGGDPQIKETAVWVILGVGQGPDNEKEGETRLEPLKGPPKNLLISYQTNGCIMSGYFPGPIQAPD